jgi:hypothetical protein
MHRRLASTRTAKGILTTFVRGDYSLAVTQIRSVPAVERDGVIALVIRALTPEELAILARYAHDLL